MQALDEQEILEVSGGISVWELVKQSWDFWVNGNLPGCNDCGDGPNTNGSFDNIPGDASAGA